MIKYKSHPLLDFDDLLIETANISIVSSRKDINIRYKNGYLPLMTAPMDTVICNENIEIFKNNGIMPVIPRVAKGEPTYLNPDTFMSYGLEEFENVFLKNSIGFMHEKVYALIDIANGHMNDLYTITKKAKEIYGDRLVLMIGNIANPDTYLAYCKTNVDYIRVGIGNGCFIDDSPVITIDGDKKIQEIEIGDKVLTHKGNYKEVVDTQSFIYDGNVIEINNEITCTPNHQFYVLNKKYIDIVNDENIESLCEWVSAEDLYYNSDYLLVENNI